MRYFLNYKFHELYRGSLFAHPCSRVKYENKHSYFFLTRTVWGIQTLYSRSVASTHCGSIMSNHAIVARCIFSPPVRMEWLEFLWNTSINPPLFPFIRLIYTCTQIVGTKMIPPPPPNNIPFLTFGMPGGNSKEGCYSFPPFPRDVQTPCVGNYCVWSRTMLPMLLSAVMLNCYPAFHNGSWNLVMFRLAFRNMFW